MEMRYTRTNILETSRERGWSIAYVARKLGYDVSYLYKVSNGDRAITATLVERACDLFKVDPDALFFDPQPVHFRNIGESEREHSPEATHAIA